MKFLSLLVRVLGLILLILTLFPYGYFVLDEQRLQTHTQHHFIPNKVLALLINLDSSHERLKATMPQVISLGYEFKRISAVNGNSLSDDYINKIVDIAKYKIYMGHTPKKGMIGCNLSHYNSWVKFLESDAEYAIIFEDDVSFAATKVKTVIEMLLKNNNLWDIAALELSHRGSPLPIKQLTDEQKAVIYLTEVTHTGGYIINRYAAAKLISRFFPIKLPIDHYYNRSWEHNVKFIGIEPRIVHQTLNNSDIATSNRYKASEVKSDILDIVKRVHYKYQSYLARFLYNLSIYYKL